MRHLYRSIPKPLTTSEDVALLSEASAYQSVCDLVVVWLQTWSFALSFNGIVVSPPLVFSGLRSALSVIA